MTKSIKGNTMLATPGGKKYKTEVTQEVRILTCMDIFKLETIGRFQILPKISFKMLLTRKATIRLEGNDYSKVNSF